MKKCGIIFGLFIFIFAFILMKYDIIVFADSEIPSSEFEDSNFYQYIIESFDTNGDGMLQQSEAEAVETINIILDEKNILSIKGVEHFTNLLFLGISTNGNSLKSIEPVRKLTKLNSLYIGGNYELTDFSPISDLTSLEYLYCDRTNIEDLSVISNLNLKSLSLQNCKQITDFTPISDMTGLYNLYLEYTNFNDTAILNNLINLVELDLSYTEINEIEFLRKMTNLEKLRMRYAESVDDFSVLGELISLRELDVSNSDVLCTQVQGLSSLTNMESIIISGSNLTVLPDMTGWTNLSTAYFSDNKITEEEAMAKLPAHITSQENWREDTGLIYQRNDEEETSDDTQENETIGNTDEERVITSVSDDNISAQGVFESDIYLEAKRIENTSDYDELIKQVHGRLTDIVDISIYDIWLYKNGIKDGENIRIKVQPDGRVKIMIKIEEIEEVRYHVFRQEEDDTLTKLESSIEGGTLIFYSEHFSIFTVVISRLLEDEDDTVNNPYESDKDNPIKVQQQGIKVPSLHEAESNEGGTTKTEDKIKNKNDNNNNDNKKNNDNKNNDDNENTGIDESNSISWDNVDNVIEADDKSSNEKLSNDNSNGNGEKRNNIEGILGIGVIAAVGAGLFGYDMLKRKKGDYMRNFQADELKEDLTNLK